MENPECVTEELITFKYGSRWRTSETKVTNQHKTLYSCLESNSKVRGHFVKWMITFVEPAKSLLTPTWNFFYSFYMLSICQRVATIIHTHFQCNSSPSTKMLCFHLIIHSLVSQFVCLQIKKHWIDSNKTCLRVGEITQKPMTFWCRSRKLGGVNLFFFPFLLSLAEVYSLWLLRVNVWIL